MTPAKDSPYKIPKKIFYVLLPFIVIVCLEAMDGWTGWKAINLFLHKNKSVAEIMENPFYELIEYGDALNEYGEIDEEYLMDYNITNNYPPIKYKYVSATGTEYFGSLYYNAYYEGYSSGEIGDLDYHRLAFAKNNVHRPTGWSFDIYYYSDQSIPVYVYDEYLHFTGRFRVFFQQSIVMIFLFALFISFVIYSYQFTNSGRKESGAWNKIFEKGVNLYYDNKHEQALNNFEQIEEAISKNGDNQIKSKFYAYMADCLGILGFHHDAIEKHNKSIALDPDDCSNYYMRSISKGQILDHEGEIDDLKMAIRLSQKDTYSNNQRDKKAREMGYSSISQVYSMRLRMVECLRMIEEDNRNRNEPN